MSKSQFFILSMLVLSTNTNATSKMKEAIKQSRISQSCQNKLIRIADNIIGKRKHRILEKNHGNSKTFHAFVLLSYTDQDSHLSFSAYEADKICRIDMDESYELPANCLDARNSIFKRWKRLGKLDDKTIVMRYDSPRDKKTLITDENARAMGFLTQTQRGKNCLITKKQYDMPMPIKKEEEKN